MQVTVVNVASEPLDQEFDELFREHYSLIFNTAYSVTGRPQDAEDVAQTIFMRLYRRGVPPNFEDNPKGYLYRAPNKWLWTVKKGDNEIVTIRDCLDVQDKWLELIQDTINELQTAREAEG